MDLPENWERSLPQEARRRREQRRRARRRRRSVRRWLGACVVTAFPAAVIVLSAGGHSSPRAATHKVVAPGSPASLPADLGLLRPGGPSPSGLPPREDRAISRALSYTSFVRAGSPRHREVALTFDDGPGPYTPQVIRVLHRLHTPATFFEIGFMLRWFHGSTSRELADSFVIGDHTETHPKLGRLPTQRQRAELLAQAGATRREGAPFPRLFRPPFGSFDTATLRVLRRLRMLMVLWTVDSKDYAHLGPKAIVQRVVKGARPGAIVLMHDAGGNRSATVTALPYIIRKLRGRHYRLVTVPRLVLDDPPPRGQPVPKPLTGD